MKYFGFSILTMFAVTIFSFQAQAMKLQSQDSVNEVIHGKPVKTKDLAHRFDEKKFPPVGDIPMMSTPKKVEKGKGKEKMNGIK